MIRLGAAFALVLLGPGLGSALAWHAYSVSGSAAWRLGAAALGAGAAAGLARFVRIVWRRRIAAISSH